MNIAQKNADKHITNNVKHVDLKSSHSLNANNIAILVTFILINNEVNNKAKNEIINLIICISFK